MLQADPHLVSVQIDEGKKESPRAQAAWAVKVTGLLHPFPPSSPDCKVSFGTGLPRLLPQQPGAHTEFVGQRDEQIRGAGGIRLSNRRSCGPGPAAPCTGDLPLPVA